MAAIAKSVFGRDARRTIPPRVAAAWLLIVTAWMAGGSAVAQTPTKDAKPAAEDTKPPADEKLEHVLLREPDNRTKLDAYWDNGFRLESSDKSFRLHVGGSAQIDSTWLIGPQSVFAIPGGGMNGIDNSAATFLRRVRFRFEGDVYEQFDYLVQYDFANAANENSGLEPPSVSNLSNTPVPCNVWVQARDLPYLGSVRLGHQKKPLGMANNTSHTSLPFMERPDNHDAFYGPFDSGYALGITSRNMAESGRATWQYGVYRPMTNTFGVAIDKGAYGGRVTALPVYEDEGRRLIHIGFGTMTGELPENQLRVRARPVLRNGPGFAVPVLVDTGEIPGSRQYTLAPEFAAVFGSWTVQAEWAGQFLADAIVNGAPPVTVFYHGAYVEVLYFLTGEHQEYDQRDGTFGRVIPRNNFHVVKGDACRTYGAWQLGARFSYVDLTDNSINGGQVYDWTAGVNWYLTPTMKLQFNYILEHRDGPQDVATGWFNGIGMRAAYVF